MATYSLSGTGVQALSSNVTAVHVDITTHGLMSGKGTANPLNYFHEAMLRFGDTVGYFDAIPVAGGPQWLAVPFGTTRLGYACQNGAAISVVEVIGGTPPFGSTGALSSLTDVALTSPADAQVLAYQATSSKWINSTPSGGSGSAPFASVLLASSSATMTLPATGSIPATAKHLRLLLVTRNTTAVSGSTAQLWLRFNGDSGANYNSDVTNAIRIADTTDSVRAATVFSSCSVDIYDYAGSNWKNALGVGMNNYDTASIFFNTHGGMWKNTAAITTLTVTVPSGALAAGSRADLYLV